MDFGIMFFSSADRETGGAKYRMVLEATRFADARGFGSVWIPERHFHAFGGLFPNPSVVCAALAALTDRLRIHSGSVVSPLHHPVRIAEEWAVVDNLSGGRVSLSFASGWNVNDFIFFPERYRQRRKLMYEQIETVRELWRGGTLVQTNSFGKEIEIAVYPKPVQAELPVWITSSGSPETIADAGAMGANLLTHLEDQDIDTLGEKIKGYREALGRHGHDPGHGKVGLMLHTYLGGDAEKVKAKVREPMRRYLKTAVTLEQKAAEGGGTVSGGFHLEPHEIKENVMEELLDAAFERYFHTAALMGTPSQCIERVWRLREIGVDEIACLIDFLDDPNDVLEGLTYLDELRIACTPEHGARVAESAKCAFMDELET